MSCVSIWYLASHRAGPDAAQIDLRIVAASLRLVASDKVVGTIAIEGISLYKAEFPQEFWMIL
jgi:hypothetical protein